MLKIEKAMRDEIVRWLKGQIVPAEIGAGMIAIANMLGGLEEIVPEVKKEPEVEVVPEENTDGPCNPEEEIHV